MPPASRNDDDSIIPSDTSTGIPLPPSLLLVVLTFAMCGMLLVVFLLCRLLSFTQKRKETLQLKIEQSNNNKKYNDKIEKMRDVSEHLLQCCPHREDLNEIGIGNYDYYDSLGTEEERMKDKECRLHYDINSNYLTKYQSVADQELIVPN